MSENVEAERKAALAQKVIQLKDKVDNLKGKRATKDLFYFNREVLEGDEPERRENIVPHVHGEWSEFLKNSDKRLKMILVPRGTFKTTFMTEGGTIRDICRDRNQRILLANATLSNAQKFLGRIKNELRHNPKISQMYGDFYQGDLKWSNTEIEISGRRSSLREPTVTAVGVEGNLVSQHYDKIIWDDLVNRKNSMTRLQSDKVIDWWKKSLSLLEPSGEGIILGTRWAYYELYQWIFSNISDRVDIYVHGSRHKKPYCQHKQDNSLYFPERFSGDKLEELRDLHGSYIYSCFYELEPVDDETATFKKSNIHYYSDEKEDEECATCGKVHVIPADKDLVNATSCDPAVSQETHADNSAVVTASVDPQGRMWVREVTARKLATDELMTELFRHYRKWFPERMTIEAIGLGQAILTPIHDREKLENLYLPLEVLKSRGSQRSKKDRIRALLQPKFERNDVFIKYEMAGLEEELLTFPKGQHDDRIDALADLADLRIVSEAKLEEKPSSGTLSERIRKKMNQKETYVDETLGEFF